MRNRKIIRKQNHDYSSNGWYFITICTKHREHFFGEIVGGIMDLSVFGKQTSLFWNEIPNHFPAVELNEFVIMPNHIHGIIGIVGTHHGVSVSDNVTQLNQFGKTIPGSMSAIIGQFKSTLTRWCRGNEFVNFAWQSRFYDHIIRSDDSFQRISDYIITNPANWKDDKFYTP